MKPNEKTRKTCWSILLLLALLGIGPAAAAYEEDPLAEVEEEEFSRADFGRVLYAEEGVLLLRAPTQDRPGARDEATINAPVFPGDTLATERRARAEVQLAGGSFVRLDEETEVVFQALPDPYADVADTTLLQLESGVIQLSVRLAESEEFRVDTPHASLFVLTDADVRVEALGERTRVFSRRGVVEVVGEGDSVLLRGGTRTTVYAGEAPDEPRPFNTFARDGFDRWVEARMEVWAYRDASIYEDDDVEPYDELPYEVRPYYRELRRYGRWVWVDTYGYCWYPYGVGPGWRPYWDGYWVYGPTGYFWVSYEPWGWAPYHYGRWVWVTGYGWCWVPGRVFAGAWVSWAWTVDFVGWCPLDYWNRPAFIFTVRYGYFDPRVWVFVPYHHFHHRQLRHRVVPFDRVRSHLRHTAVVTRPPRVPPERLARDPEVRRRVVEELAKRDRQRIRPIRVAKREAAGGPSFREIERRIVREGRVRRARPVAGRPPVGRDEDRVARGGSGRRVGPPVADRPRERLAPRAESERGVPGRQFSEGAARRTGRGEPDDEADRSHRGRPARRIPPPSVRDDDDGPRRREAAPAERRDRDRVRDFYRRLAPGRREVRPDEGGDRSRDRARTAPRPAPRPREGIRREPSTRREAPRARPRPQPRRESPRAQPEREAPKRESPRAKPREGGKPKGSSRRSRGSARESRGGRGG